MAIHVNILDDGQGLEFILLDTIYGKEIIEAHQKTHDPDVVSKLKYKIIDKSKVKQNYISVEEVKIIADLDREIARNYPDIVTAVIVPNDVIDSTAGLWERYTDGDIKNLKRFYSREEADKWIKDVLNKI